MHIACDPCIPWHIHLIGRKHRVSILVFAGLQLLRHYCAAIFRVEAEGGVLEVHAATQTQLLNTEER